MACFSFIDGWYNPVRLHSAVSYRSPGTYEVAMEAITTQTQLRKPSHTPRNRGSSKWGLQPRPWSTEPGASTGLCINKHFVQNGMRTYDGSAIP